MITKDTERGRVPNVTVVVIALLVVFGGALAFCGDALFEDEDERNDLGQRHAWVQSFDRGHHYGGDHDDHGDGAGECEEAKNCSDDDLSPSFEDSPITICLVPDSCPHRGEA